MAVRLVAVDVLLKRLCSLDIASLWFFVLLLGDSHESKQSDGKSCNKGARVFWESLRPVLD